MPIIGTPVNPGPNVLAVPTVTQKYGQSIFARQQAISIVQGQPVAINWTMKDSSGVAINLSNHTGAIVTLRISEALFNQSIAQYTDIPGTISDPTNGIVTAQLTPAVVAYAGISIAEFALLDENNNVIYSNKFYLNVEFGQFGATTTRTGPPTLAEIRLHMRDSDPNDNYLLDETEFDAAEIAACIIRPIEQFNNMQPPLNTVYNTSNFPFRYYWLEGIVANLYKMAAANYRRNHLPYSGGGLSVDDLNKEQSYMQAAMMHQQIWEDWAKHKKIEMNMNAGMTEILSGYSTWFWPGY